MGGACICQDSLHGQAWLVLFLSLIGLSHGALASVVRVEAEDAAQVSRGAGWSLASGSVLSANQGLEAIAANAVLTLTFESIAGGSAGVYGRKGTWAEITSSIDVTLDALTVSASFLSATFTFQQEYVLFSGLAAGIHTLSVRTLGALPQIDFFTIEPPPPAAVPEPASLALLGLGLAAIGFRGRRQPPYCNCHEPLLNN